MAACSSKKHRWESDDATKFDVFTGWFDFRVEVSDSSSLPCWKDTTATIKPWPKLARLLGRLWDCLAEIITQKGWLKAINRPLRTKMWVGHMLIVQSLDVDLPLCDKPKCRNSRKPSVQLDWFRLVQGPMNRLRFGWDNRKWKTSSGGQKLFQSPLECHGPWVKLWFPKSVYFDRRPRRNSLPASKWCCFSFSLGPVQEPRHPASHRPRPSVWFAKWLGWSNPAVLVDHAGVVLHSRLQDWTYQTIQTYPNVFWAVGRSAWQLVLPKNIGENPMTCRSLMSSLDNLTSAWKYQIPVPCRVEKMPKFCCSHQTSPKTCTFVPKAMGLRRYAALSGKVGPSTLEQLRNALGVRRTEPTWCNIL